MAEGCGLSCCDSTRKRAGFAGTCRPCAISVVTQGMHLLIDYAPNWRAARFGGGKISETSGRKLAMNGHHYCLVSEMVMQADIHISIITVSIWVSPTKKQVKTALTLKLSYFPSTSECQLSDPQGRLYFFPLHWFDLPLAVLMHHALSDCLQPNLAY